MEQKSFTVDQWAARHGICRATAYNLLKAGKGPRTMKFGSARRISEAADAEWVAQMEAETAQREAAAKGASSDAAA